MTIISLEGIIGVDKTLYLKRLEQEYHEPDLRFYENSPYILNAIQPGLNLKVDWVPNVIIYLFCSPYICHSHVNRNTNPLDHLLDLHTRYEIICDELNCPIKIYKVNAQEETDTVYRNIKDIIDKIH